VREIAYLVELPSCTRRHLESRSVDSEPSSTPQVACPGSTRVGFDPKYVIELRVSKKWSSFEIVPAQSLPPGEYFLTAGFSSLGYDFSVPKVRFEGRLRSETHLGDNVKFHLVHKCFCCLNTSIYDMSHSRAESRLVAESCASAVLPSGSPCRRQINLNVEESWPP
jgi:hypothetical protein